MMLSGDGTFRDDESASQMGSVTSIEGSKFILSSGSGTGDRACGSRSAIWSGSVRAGPSSWASSRRWPRPTSAGENRGLCEPRPARPDHRDERGAWILPGRDLLPGDRRHGRAAVPLRTANRPPSVCGQHGGRRGALPRPRNPRLHQTRRPSLQALRRSRRHGGRQVERRDHHLGRGDARQAGSAHLPAGRTQ